MTLHAPAQRPVPRQLVFLVWAGLAFLLFIGISAAALRATHLADLTEWEEQEAVREADRVHRG